MITDNLAATTCGLSACCLPVCCLTSVLTLPPPLFAATPKLLDVLEVLQDFCPDVGLALPSLLLALAAWHVRGADDDDVLFWSCLSKLAGPK